jgi:hypothetical protein
MKRISGIKQDEEGQEENPQVISTELLRSLFGMAKVEFFQEVCSNGGLIVLASPSLVACNHRFCCHGLSAKYGIEL